MPMNLIFTLLFSITIMIAVVRFGRGKFVVQSLHIKPINALNARRVLKTTYC